MSEVERRLLRLEEQAQEDTIAAMSVEELDAILDEDPIGRKVLEQMSDKELAELARGKPDAMRRFAQNRLETSKMRAG